MLQKYGDLSAVGQSLIEPFHAYAWSKDGRKTFPSELFDTKIQKSDYLKFAVSALIKNGVPSDAIDKIPKNLMNEIEAIKRIRPNSIIN